MCDGDYSSCQNVIMQLAGAGAVLPAHHALQRVGGSEGVSPWRAKLANCTAFREMVINIDRAGVKECRFQLNADGWSVSCMDSSHVSMLESLIPACAFAPWELEDDAHTIAVSIPQLRKLCNVMKSGDALTLSAGKDNTFDLFIEQQESGLKAAFAVKALDLDDEPLTVPADQIWGCVVTMRVGLLKEALKAMAIAGDTVVIQASVSQGLCIRVPSTAYCAGAQVLKRRWAFSHFTCAGHEGGKERSFASGHERCRQKGIGTNHSGAPVFATICRTLGRQHNGPFAPGSGIPMQSCL